MIALTKIPRRLQQFNALEIMKQAIIDRVNTEAELEYANEPHNYFASTRDNNYHRYVRNYKGVVSVYKPKTILQRLKQFLP